MTIHSTAAKPRPTMTIMTYMSQGRRNHRDARNTATRRKMSQKIPMEKVGAMANRNWGRYRVLKMMRPRWMGMKRMPMTLTPSECSKQKQQRSIRQHIFSGEVVHEGLGYTSH